MWQKDYNISCVLGYVGLSIFTQFGSHDVLLETNYDLWAKIEILGPLPTLCEPTGSYT